MRWTRSSLCHDGSCILAAHDAGTIYVRDSKLADLSPALAFTIVEWGDLLADVRDGG